MNWQNNAIEVDGFRATVTPTEDTDWTDWTCKVIRQSTGSVLFDSLKWDIYADTESAGRRLCEMIIKKTVHLEGLAAENDRIFRLLVEARQKLEMLENEKTTD